VERIVRAAARNQSSWMAGVARIQAGGVHRVGPLRVVEHGGDATVLFPWRASASAFDALLEWCCARDVRQIGVWATGLAPVDGLRARLLERGFEEGWRPHWMTIEASKLPLGAEDERVAIVDAVPEYDAYGQALLGLARQPRFWHAAARLDGVYAGHAWSHRVGECAGIYDVDVHPHFRRRGLGTALTLAAIRAAGAALVVLNATGDGEALYRALGFRSVGFGWTWWWDRGARGAQL
jgi:ribosomal protein S18 acetylase RimI-like enzyme